MTPGRCRPLLKSDTHLGVPTETPLLNTGRLHASSSCLLLTNLRRFPLRFGFRSRGCKEDEKKKEANKTKRKQENERLIISAPHLLTADITPPLTLLRMHSFFLPPTLCFFYNKITGKQ